MQCRKKKSRWMQKEKRWMSPMMAVTEVMCAVTFIIRGSVSSTDQMIKPRLGIYHSHIYHMTGLITSAMFVGIDTMCCLALSLLWIQVLTCL